MAIKEFISQTLEQRNMHESLLEEEPAILEVDRTLEDMIFQIKKNTTLSLKEIVLNKQWMKIKKHS